MKAALRGSYVDYVIFMGTTEKYPSWFQRELETCSYTDESRFTFWVFPDERRPDYYEKQLIEEYSVFLRKPNGEIHITEYDTFQYLYVSFRFDAFTNSGLAGYEMDCIEYVECKPGILDDGYPEWFYEYYTEAVLLPDQFSGYLLISENHEITITEHCVTLRNRLGEIRTISYTDFIKYYDDDPAYMREEFLQYNQDNR